MAEDTNLQNILMEELSEIDLFCKLIKYPSIRASMLKCFKVTRTTADLMANKIFLLKVVFI